MEPIEGLKYDQGKPRWELAPYDAIRCIVIILTYGAVKYPERNWELGMAWSRPYAALMRHMTSWWQGEDTDKETGHSHLWHAGCCILFLIAYELRNRGTDDRPMTTLHARLQTIRFPADGTQDTNLNT